MIGDMDKIEPMDLETVQQYENYAGRLKENIVMVDFDDRDQANRMLQLINDYKISCNVIQTTKGMHFYFLNDSSIESALVKSVTILGFEVDYKLGSKHAYSPLKINGFERTVLKKAEKIGKIPDFLKPIKVKHFKRFVKNDPNLYKLSDGDGRNDFLHKYILYLNLIEKFSRDKIRELFGLISEYVFDSPMTKYELDTICREDRFSGIEHNLFFGGPKGNTFLHNEFAKFIRERHSVVKLHGVPQIYIDGRYYAEGEDGKFEGIMLKYVDSLKANQRKEVLSWLKSSLETENIQEADPKYLLLRNGVYNLTHHELKETDSSLIFKNIVDVEYNPHIHDEHVERFVTDFACGDQEVIDLLWEMIAYCLDRRQKNKVMFFLHGPRAHNGKSTFLNMLAEFLGIENVANIGPQDLGGQQSRFNKIELYGKLVNIVDDVDAGYIENTGTIKSMVDGRQVHADRKGQSQIKFKNYATFLFGGNEIPKSKDKTPGWMDRLLIIPCDAYYPPGDPRIIKNIDDLLTTNNAKSYILNMALEGYKRIKDGGFTKSAAAVEAKQMHMLDNNSFLRFMDEDEPDCEAYTLKELHLKYAVWCEENDIHTPAKRNQIKDELLRLGYQVGEKKKRPGDSGGRRYLERIDE